MNIATYRDPAWGLLLVASLLEGAARADPPAAPPPSVAHLLHETSNYHDAVVGFQKLTAQHAKDAAWIARAGEVFLALGLRVNDDPSSVKAR